MPAIEPPRPQQVLIPLLGDHVIAQGLCVSTASLIDVLGTTGVGEHAVRSTVSRLARRGLLQRVPVGRETYVGTTDRGAEVMLAGRDRTLDGEIVSHDWDGTWTTVLFTMPEHWQRQRSDLRARLQWAGFGPLQNGVWVAPRRVDGTELLAGLEAAPHVRVLQASPEPPTTSGDLVSEAYDLRALARTYRQFERRWARGGPRGLRDALTRQLLLTADWLQTVREDPRLPAQLLPQDWPGLSAQGLFRTQWQDLNPQARQVASAVLATIPAPTRPRKDR